MPKTPAVAITGSLHAASAGPGASPVRNRGSDASSSRADHGRAHRGGRDRVADEVALRLVAPEVAQTLELMDGLDTLGDQVEPHRMRHGDDRAHERAVVAASAMPWTKARSILMRWIGNCWSSDSDE